MQPLWHHVEFPLPAPLPTDSCCDGVGYLKWAFTPRLTDDGSYEVGQMVLGTAKCYRTLFGKLYYLRLEIFQRPFDILERSFAFDKLFECEAF
jgi:hypothetical protein